MIVCIKFTLSSLKVLQDLGYILTPMALSYLDNNYQNHYVAYITIRESKGTLRADTTLNSTTYLIGLNRASEILTLFNLGFSLEEAYDTIRGNL